MKKLLSIALTGAIALSAGAYYTNSTPDFSAFSEDYTEITYENLRYEKYIDHVEVGDNRNNRELTEVVIPAEIEGLPVTEIGTLAFLNCSKLKSVTIPDSVTKIEKCAFQGCTSLTSINIPDSVTDIGSSVFYGTAWLKMKQEENPFVVVNGTLVYTACNDDVVIPDSVTKIVGGSFEDCENCTSITIPDSVTEIGEYAFSSCAFKSIDIPSSVTSIGWYAFSPCANLESITIRNPECVIDDTGTWGGFNFGSTICNEIYKPPYATTVYRFYGTIYGYEGSTAQKYAETFNRNFVALDGEPPVTTEETKTLKGDVNGDNSVTIADAVAILQYLANSDEYALSEQGLKNADVLGDDGVNTEDALQIQKLDAGVIEKL